MTKVRQFLCGLRGHCYFLHFQGIRIMMRCSECGHTTPGWELGRPAHD